MSADAPQTPQAPPQAPAPLAPGEVLDPDDYARRFPSRAAFLALRGGLTWKQRAFCVAYLGRAQGNGSLAAQLAGYAVKPEHASQLARRILQSPKVIEYLSRKLKRQRVMSRDETLGELTAVGRVKVPISERGKLKALEIMAKHHKIVDEAAQVSVHQTVVTTNQLQAKIDGYAGALRSASAALVTPPDGARLAAEDEALDTLASDPFANSSSAK